MKVLLTILSFVVSLSAFSQSGYVERLKKKTGSEGAIVFHQDDRISRLLETDSAFTKIRENLESDKLKVASKNKNKGLNDLSLGKQIPDTLGADSNDGNPSAPVHTRRYKVEGFRIQIYAGNNSRKSRIEATSAGQKIKDYFPELPVYTHFYPPRWICRVGDFRTSGEAETYLSQIRNLKVFSSVTLIKTTIQVPY